MTVLELFQRVINRMPHMKPTISFVDAAHAVQVTIARRLWEVHSDLLRDIWESEEQAIGVSVVDLPLDMLGIAKDFPYVTFLTPGGDTTSAILRPLTRPRSDYVVDPENSTAREYDIRGSIMEIFPAHDTAYTLNVMMFRTPAPLVDMKDELPWNGFYDHLFQDAVLHMASAAGIATMVSPLLEKAIMRAVDSGASLRTGRRVNLLFA
jgi:hypothetical protein